MFRCFILRGLFHDIAHPCFLIAEMASKRSKKQRALNVVNQEFKDPETRLKLMAQTYFELPLSQEQTEKPKK